VETRSRDLDEQLNRIFVVQQIESALEALKSENREKSAALLQQAYDKIESSDSKGKLQPSPPPQLYITSKLGVP
jgi:hypothetical protein